MPKSVEIENICPFSASCGPSAPLKLVSLRKMCYTPFRSSVSGGIAMEKIRTTVKIAGKEYTIAGYDSKEHVRHVAGIVDRRMNELAIQTRLPAAQLSVLAAMNMADEMVKAQAELVKVRRELDLARLQLEQLKNERE